MFGNNYYKNKTKLSSKLIGPSGPPGIYDPRLDEVSVGAIGAQGDVGEDGERGT